MLLAVGTVELACLFYNFLALRIELVLLPVAKLGAFEVVQGRHHLAIAHFLARWSHSQLLVVVGTHDTYLAHRVHVNVSWHAKHIGLDPGRVVLAG